MRQILSAYYVSEPVLRAGDTAVNDTDMVLLQVSQTKKTVRKAIGESIPRGQ